MQRRDEEMIDWFTCEDFLNDFEISRQCCGSCHSDSDNGYAHMCEREIDGKTYQVCCALLCEYDEKFKEEMKK